MGVALGLQATLPSLSLPLSRHAWGGPCLPSWNPALERLAGPAGAQREACSHRGLQTRGLCVLFLRRSRSTGGQGPPEIKVHRRSRSTGGQGPPEAGVRVSVWDNFALNVSSVHTAAYTAGKGSVLGRDRAEGLLRLPPTKHCPQ